MPPELYLYLRRCHGCQRHRLESGGPHVSSGHKMFSGDLEPSKVSEDPSSCRAAVLSVKQEWNFLKDFGKLIGSLGCKIKKSLGSYVSRDKGQPHHGAPGGTPEAPPLFLDRPESPDSSGPGHPAPSYCLQGARSLSLQACQWVDPTLPPTLLLSKVEFLIDVYVEGPRSFV